MPLAEVAKSTAALRARLLALMNASNNADLRDLASSIPSGDAGDSVCIAFVGQYDAGKSSLINCLTGLTIPTGADVKTTTTASYPWNGHLLVDTPGVLAGVDTAHDRAAEEAIRAADAVVFVVTTEGFDDVTAGYFASLRRQLRNLGQLIIVVNKAHSEESSRELVAEHLRVVMGDAFDVVPTIWTEASDWLKAEAFPNPESRRARSEIRQLALDLDEVVRGRGAHLRLATPIRELSRFTTSALDRCLASQDGERVLESLSQAAETVEQQRRATHEAIAKLAEETSTGLAAQLMEAGPDLTQDESESLLAQAYVAFDEAVRGTLTEEAAAMEGAVEVYSPTPTVSSHSPAIVAAGSGLTWEAVRQQLLRGFSTVGREFAGQGARPGGVGNEAVKRVWHAVGGRFKPWGATKASLRTAKVAKFAGPALLAGEAAWGVWSEYQQARRTQERADQARSWRAAALTIAADATGPWADAAFAEMNELCDRELQVIGRQRLLVLAGLELQGDEIRELVAIDSELLDQLACLEGA
jgi:predicted GTPase